MVFYSWHRVCKTTNVNYEMDRIMDIATHLSVQRFLPLPAKTALMLSLLVVPMQLTADQTSIIATKVMQGAGRAAINQAAGDHNLQSNSHVLGQSTSLHSLQKHNVQPLVSFVTRSDLQAQLEDDELHLSVIDSQAFAHFQGLVSVNQVSGQGNIQTNLGSIALASIAGLGLSDDALTQVSSQIAPSFHPSQYHVDIAPDSFLEAQGVVQINQISGDSNIAVNQFSLQLPSGN
jgi:hypothetical protein